MRPSPPLRVSAAALLLLAAACAGGGITPAPAGPAAEVERVTALAAPPPISAAEYARRRAALAAAMGDGVLVALGSAAPSADYLTFFQNSPFRYLTGLTEPGAALLIEKRGGAVREQLFIPARDPSREVWEGARLGAEGAAQRTGIPARDAEAFWTATDSLLRRQPTLYTLFPGSGDEVESADSTARQQRLAALAAERGARTVPLDDVLNRLRGTKSPAELDRIRRAVVITSLAQRAAMRSIEPGMNEFEIQALIEYVFRRSGAERPGFASIVGSGPNSVTLHYNADDRFMQPGETVVMDIGASYRGYSADVTRTVPVSGRFSPEQRAVYETVLAAQKAAEAVARPGATWAELTSAANREVAAGLARLGLIDAPEATYACGAGGQVGRCPQYRLFFMHGLGHGIGLDVHDPDAFYFGPLQAGSAFTIEPGIYVRPDALDYLPNTPENRAMIQRLRPAVERFRNIGVRIEDDYFITATGVERISDGSPREIAQIEALMAEPGPGNRNRQPAVVEWYRQTEAR